MDKAPNLGDLSLPEQVVWNGAFTYAMSDHYSRYSTEKRASSVSVAFAVRIANFVLDDYRKVTDGQSMTDRGKAVHALTQRLMQEEQAETAAEVGELEALQRANTIQLKRLTAVRDFMKRRFDAYGPSDADALVLKDILEA